MFSLSFTINLAVGDSVEQLRALTTLLVCFLWIIWSGEFISTFLVDNGDRVLVSFNPSPFLFGKSSLGCVTFIDFLGLFSVSAEKKGIRHTMILYTMAQLFKASLA